MDSKVNVIVCKVQRELYAEVNEKDAELIRRITRKLATLSYGEKMLCITTYSVSQIIEKFGN